MDKPVNRGKSVSTQSNPKFLINSKSLDKISNPSEFIKKARENYLKKSLSKPVNALHPCNKSFTIQSKTSFKFFHRKNSESLQSTSNNFMHNNKTVEEIPEWLMKRPGFQEIVNTHIDYSSEIPKICQEHCSSRSSLSKKILFEWVSSLKFFSLVSTGCVQEVCDKLSRVDFLKGEVLIRKGDEGDCLYIIYSGSVEIYLEPSVMHCKVFAKNVIGELALDNSKPRNATVIASENVVALRLNRYDYEAILFNFKRMEKNENSKFLATIQPFSHWNFAKVQNLSYYLIQKTYDKGEVIYDVNDLTDCFYIIKSGTVEIQAFTNILQNNCWPTGGKSWKIQEINRKYVLTIAKLKEKDYFGEACVLGKVNHVTKAICTNKTVCLCINEEDFFSYFSKSDLELLRLNAKVIIPNENELKKKMIDEIKLKYINKQAIHNSISVDFKYAEARESLLDEKTKKMKKWIRSRKKRIKLENSLLHKRIVTEEKRNFMVNSIKNINDYHINSQL